MSYRLERIDAVAKYLEDCKQWHCQKRYWNSLERIPEEYGGNDQDWIDDKPLRKAASA
jgi:hypothetical protein